MCVFNSGIKDTKELKPGEAVLYTWPNALGKREIIWSCGDKKDQKNDLIKVHTYKEISVCFI